MHLHERRSNGVVEVITVGVRVIVEGSTKEPLRDNGRTWPDTTQLDVQDISTVNQDLATFKVTDAGMCDLE